MQVSITQLANGTTADATAVDANFNNIANVLNGNIDATNLAGGTIGASAYADGWTPLIGITPTSVTYNGNRNYSLVFNGVNLTSQISNGMRLKGTRTVTAPTQCTSLNGTTQFYSKTTPNGMTFTNNFVVSAWVKASAYQNSSIVSRYNGTSGWRLAMGASGQISLEGYNAGAANSSVVQSYQSIPLNKWVHITAQLDMATFTATPTTSYVMIDGVDVPSAVIRGGTNPTALVQAGNLEIGSWNGGLLPFTGKIAQVAIYSAKVTEATIQASISQGLAGTETSLISAYSFNNSINDLNANANNLTANGSAVATNADSPFAGGANASTAYTAGTTEFGEVFDISFSTNTTVVVQVPDGYAIPTTGGVSAVSYSTQDSPLGAPAKINLIGYAAICTSFTTTGTGTQVLGLSAPIYIPKGRAIKVVMGATNAQVTNANDDWNLKIWDGTVGSGTQFGQASSTAAATVASVFYAQTIPTYLSSGNHTINAGWGTSSTRTITLNGTTAQPAFIEVRLV